MTPEGINPMHAAPRCRARSKRTGLPCRSPAVRTWQVCRMHGARGGAPTGARNGRYRHGAFTCEVIEAVRMMNALARECRNAVEF